MARIAGLIATASERLSMWIAEAAHQMALLPVLWLAGQAWRGRRFDVSYWWTAYAFFVSWVADTFTDTISPDHQWLPALVFPLGQCALIGAVWLPSRKIAVEFVALLTLAGLCVALWGNLHGPDIVLASLANGGVAWIAWRYRELPERLRFCLLMYFFVGGLFWLIHALDVMYWPDVSVRSWYSYQLSRLAGLLAFCYATTGTRRQLRTV